LSLGPEGKKEFQQIENHLTTHPKDRKRGGPCLCLVSDKEKEKLIAIEEGYRRLEEEEEISPCQMDLGRGERGNRKVESCPQGKKKGNILEFRPQQKKRRGRGAMCFMGRNKGGHGSTYEYDETPSV